jgi:hypothetical protein
MGTRCTDYGINIYSQNSELTSPTNGCCSVGKVLLRNKTPQRLLICFKPTSFLSRHSFHAQVLCAAKLRHVSCSVLNLRVLSIDLCLDYV